MERIRIVTTSTPHREVDFRDNAVFVRLPDTNYDAIARGVNGAETVYGRAHRRNFELEIDGLSVADLEILRAIHGDRQAVYFEANISEHTKIYNPFERSVDPLIGAAATFARATVATYLDDDDLIKAVASGYPRFETGKLGKGILLESQRTNYFYPSHGSSGDTIWSVGGGTPTINWDTGVASNIDGEVGTIRIDGTTSDCVDVDVTFPNATPMSAFVYVRGRGACVLTVDAGGTATSMLVTLTMEWQKLYFENSTSTATTVTLRIGISEGNTTIWLSGHQLENGREITSYIPTTSAATTRNLDSLSYASQFNYIEGSIAMWVRWPRRVTSCYNRMLFYVGANFYALIDASGQIYWKVSSSTSSYITPSPMFTVGDMVHIAFVWKDDYAAVVVNGVAYDVDASNTRNAGSFTTVQLYSGINTCPYTVIDDLRIDNRYVEWRTSEDGEYIKYSGAATLHLAKLTQGRTFRVTAGELAPREADPSYFDGKLKISEASSESDHTVEVA